MSNVPHLSMAATGLGTAASGLYLLSMSETDVIYVAHDAGVDVLDPVPALVGSALLTAGGLVQALSAGLGIFNIKVKL